MRKIKFVNEKYYHVYNRGANKQEVFLDEQDYFRFLWKVREMNNELKYNQRQYLKNQTSQTRKTPEVKALTSGVFKQVFKSTDKLVEIICYSLLPNHYHFILKQLIDGGIEKFMRKLGISYAKYFNHKYNHMGVLFQSRFKAFSINNEDKLCQLSAYVSCNYQIHKLGLAEKWQFSSYLDYLQLRKGNPCAKDIILELFNHDLNHYREYCELIIKDKQEIKKWQKLYEG